MLIKRRLKTLESAGLSIGTDLIDNRTMKDISAAGAAAVTQALMQLPDSISEPCQLKRAEIIGTTQALQGMDPVGQAAS